MTARLILSATAAADRELWLAARRQGVTASEIAAILGISPFESAYNLYWKKTGVLPEDYDDERLSLGRHLEPWIAERFAVEHPEFVLQAPAGLWGNTERDWQLATPDGLICEDAGFGALPVAVWEGKTSATYEEWGEDGTDEVPAYIAAQVQWQMDVLNVTTAYVSCLFLATQKIRTYVIERDEADVELMRARGLEFWQRVQSKDPPPLDSHDATMAALKALYPDIDDDEEAQVPDDLAVRYRTACDAVKRAEERKAGVENEIRAAMGNAKRAVTEDGQKVASRSVYERKGYTVGPATIDRLNPTRTSKKKEDAA